MEEGSEGGRPGYLHLLWPRVEESGVRLVRIGGNGYEHAFPDEKRLVSMVAAVRAIGAEPLLQVPRRFSAEQARALVRRLNGSPATRVRFWSIGNEPLLREPEIIQQVHDYLMRIAPAMKQADPSIRIFVFDECEMRAPAFEALCGGKLDITGKNPDGTWIVDGFTFHRYPNGKEFTRDDVLVRGPADVRRQAADLVAMMAAGRPEARPHGRRAAAMGADRGQRDLGQPGPPGRRASATPRSRGGSSSPRSSGSGWSWAPSASRRGASARRTTPRRTSATSACRRTSARARATTTSR